MINLRLTTTRHPTTGEFFYDPKQNLNVEWKQLRSVEDGLRQSESLKFCYGLKRVPLVEKSIHRLRREFQDLKFPRNNIDNYASKIYRLVDNFHLDNSNLCRLTKDEKLQLWEIFLDSITKAEDSKGVLVERKGRDKLEELKKLLETEGFESWAMTMVTISTFVNDQVRRFQGYREEFDEYLSTGSNPSPSRQR